jgi:hypothetical protein
MARHRETGVAAQKQTLPGRIVARWNETAVPASSIMSRFFLTLIATAVAALIVTLAVAAYTL